MTKTRINKTTITCDRCKFEWDDLAHKQEKFADLVVNTAIQGFDGTWGYVTDKRIDLCEDCTNSFINFMEQEKDDD
jgi:hypothetical protein